MTQIWITPFTLKTDQTSYIAKKGKKTKSKIEKKSEILQKEQ